MMTTISVFEAALLVTAGIAVWNLTAVFASILERWSWQYFDNEPDTGTDIAHNLIPWVVISEEIDLYAEPWEKYIYEVLETTGKYRASMEAKVLFLGMNTAAADENASPETVQYTREVLYEFLAEHWPDAGLSAGKYYQD